MTAAPAIYGDLTDEARVLYGRWIFALFRRTEHVDWCPFGCKDTLAACDEGREVVAAEQAAWSAWNDVRRLTRG